MRKKVKKRIKNPHRGSNFEDFLKEENILEEVDLIALKRVFVFEISEEMKKLNLSKNKMAKIMRTSRSALDRILDPENTSISLNTIGKAARAVGKRVELKLTV